MVRITFIQPDSSSVTIDSTVGDTIMWTATTNKVEGIIGDCGGGMSCGTCHVLFPTQWSNVVGPAEGIEADVLEGTATPSTARSRLSCQIIVDQALDGLVVEIPATQG